MAAVLFLHFIITSYFLRRFFALRDQTGFHLGMNIVMLTGGFSGLITGVVLIDTFPFYFVWVTVIAAVMGALIGGLNGLLYDGQTALTGLANGFMMGLMGPMIGAAAGEAAMLAVMFEAVYIFLSILALITSVKS